MNASNKLVSLSYKVLTTSQPDYLHNRMSVQSTGSVSRSSSVVLVPLSTSTRFKPLAALFDMHHSVNHSSRFTSPCTITFSRTWTLTAELYMVGSTPVSGRVGSGRVVEKWKLYGSGQVRC